MLSIIVNHYFSLNAHICFKSFIIIIIPLFRRKPGESRLEYDSIKWHLANLRNKKHPKLPKLETNENVLELHRKYKHLLDEESMRKEYGRTLDDRHKLYFGSVVKSVFAFHVFVSTIVIDMIKDHITSEKQQKLFSVVPRKLNQLLIIAVEYNNDVSKDNV